MKNIIKSLILQLSALLLRDNSPKVVFYHDVGTLYSPMGTAEKVFWGHMSCLREGDVVCFDDGFRGIWDAREKLKGVSSKFRVIVFIAVGLVGKPGYLTWEEIKELQDMYGLDFSATLGLIKHWWVHITMKSLSRLMAEQRSGTGMNLLIQRWR